MVEVTPHWLFLSGPLVAALAIIGVVVGLDVGFPHTSVGGHWLEGAVAAVPAAWLLVRTVRWRRTRFVVTSARIVGYEGIVARRTWEMLLADVERVDAVQPVVRRLLGTGWLEITRAGDREVTVITDVRKPAVLQRVISRRIPPPDRPTTER